MLLIRHSLLLGVSSLLLLLSGCGSSSYNSSGGTEVSGGSTGNTGTSPPGNPIAVGGGPSGSTDLIVATPSVAGLVSVAVGAQQTISITFTSNDGSPISGFGVSGTLGTLPAGWSGPASLSCAAVSTGSGCVLNLTFAPAAVGTGTLTVNYVFVDNATMPSTNGTLSIPYAAVTNNNVVAAASPTGEIDAAIGGSKQLVTLSFTTDDGNSATNLTLTSDPATLPAGWSSTLTSLTCAIVGSGSGCQLPLSYAPTAASRGVLTLNYSYTDSAGAARTGAGNIPYAASSNDTVVATASPSGEITAVKAAGSQAVAVTFTTDDGKTASGLYLTSNLADLPAGWSSAAHTFTCGSVGTGSGCQLHLTYAPAALASGTLILNYAYTNAAGNARTGSLNVAYAATTNDNVVATAAPSGPINVIVGGGTEAVSVTFTTDDGRPASALSITSGLSALPAGWSSAAGTFSCSGLSSGNGCQLALTYAPSGPQNGTLTLGYTYLNDAGESKTGSVNIAYAATTNNNVIATPNQNPVSVIAGTSTAVSVAFTTDDSNPASALSMTGLASLPAGWSSASSSFACATLSTGSGCVLNLVYAPSAVAGGTLSLTYGYNDDSGTAKTGSLSLLYAATPPPHLYVAQLSGAFSYCALNADGTLSSCAATGNGFTAPTGIVFSGSNAYVADYGANSVFLCSAAADGSLSGCAATGSNFQQPWQLAISGSTLYASNLNSSGGVTTCSIAVDGTLSGCTQSSGGTGTAGVAAGSSFAYIGVGPATVDVCAIGGSGILSPCALAGSAFSSPSGISLLNGVAYIANQGNGTVSVCTVNTDGSLSGCAASSLGSSQPMDVAFSGSQAYVDDTAGDMYLCSVGAGGALTGCVISDGGSSFPLAVQIAIH
jgi:hypothetical protein